MKHVVHKFPLNGLSGWEIFTVSRDAVVLSVSLQRGLPNVWVQVNADPKWPTKKITVEKFETGVSFDYDPDRTFLGTLLLDNGAYVLHCYVKA